MLKMNDYVHAFNKGMNYVLYDSDEQTREFPTLDLSSMESIGYYDGYQYGEFLCLTSQIMSISDEQLFAVIDKNHTQALKRHHNYNYVCYKSGFIEGKVSILEKIIDGNIDFDSIPEIIGDEWNSIGYVDGYNYFLSEYLKNGAMTIESSESIDEIARSYFREKMNSSMEKIEKQR